MKLHLPKSLPRTKIPRVGDKKRPSRDWLALLAIALLLLIASIGWNVWTFIRITSGEVVGEGPSVVTGPDTSALERVREVFTNRKAEEQRYLTEYRFVDPSK